MQESQRFYNVAAAGSFRVALKDIVLGGQYLVPKVPSVVLSLRVPCATLQSNYAPLDPAMSKPLISTTSLAHSLDTRALPCLRVGHD